MKKITILSILLIFFSNLLFADSHDIDPTRFHLEKKNDDQGTMLDEDQLIQE